MEIVAYGAFSASLQRAVGQARTPLSATFEVTRRCPLACQHCYNNLPVGDRQARAAELQLDEHRRILDELAELGCLWLLYTGGEIFARQDFLDIYDHARSKGFLITLFTNGTQITAEVADHLAAHRPFSIEITLYGRTRETYERLTGVRGSFDRCMRGIQLLLQRGLPLKLKSVALTINKHELDDMKVFADELGVPFKFDAMMSPRIDCSQSPLAVRLQPDEVVELDLRDERRMSEWQDFAAQFVAPLAPESASHVYQCGGGVSSFAVDPYGAMSICVLSQADRIDLRTQSVRHAWEQSLRKVRGKRTTRLTKCTACVLKPLCGMCPANGELENGDPEAPVDFLCQVAHLRAHVLGLTVPEHGTCEYCAGGTGYEPLIRSLARLKETGTTSVRRARARGNALAVLPETTDSSSQGCGTGGCASCRP
jgi:radical SAM protein with 4Fe4S-binding SPASM domain